MSQSSAHLSESEIKIIAQDGTYKVPSGVRLCFYLFMLIGVLSFFQEYISGGASRKHAWMALHVNFIYWFGMAAAASGFSAVFHICNAQWVRPIRRIFESASSFLIVSPIFILILSFGAGDLFIWANTPIHGKEFWLQTNFVYIRNFLATCLMVFTLTRVVKRSIGLDITAIRSGLVKVEGEAKNKWADKFYDSFYLGDKNSKDLIRSSYDRMGNLSPLCVMVYALAMSLVAFDLLMSVDPHWYSTMFGGFYFMSAVYLAVAFVSISVFFSRSFSPLYSGAIKRKTLHDLGKLLFGFGIFWAYLFWSHYLPIWYANLPEETGYIILRLRAHPWRNVAWLVLGMCFIVPFLLGLSRDIKQIPGLLASTALIPAVGLWIQYYLLFAPSLYPDSVPLTLTDFGVAIGFLGLFASMSTSFLERYPLIPFGDLVMSEESPS